MAPNRHTASQRRESHRARKTSCQAWIKTKGQHEFDAWRADHPTQQLSYDDWKTSNHVAGLSLFFAAADIFNESDSSDEDEDGVPVGVQPRPRAVRTHSAREPKKKVTANGNGLARAASSATPSAPANSDDASPSGKRKRKAKKVFLSEEMIASDDETATECEQQVEIVDSTLSTLPKLVVNGKRKSSGRKSKKKVLSEEMISPEDDLDDPMAVDEAVVASTTSPLPVRSAPKAKSKSKPKIPVQIAEPPRKTHILKLSTRRTPKKVETDGETEQAKPVGTPLATSPVDDGAKPSIDDGIVAKDESFIRPAVPEAVSATTSPNSKDLSASATRRGLRIRRPAQQRPYYHDAQLFDDVETAESDPEDVSIMSVESRSRRTSAVSFVGKPYDAEFMAHLDAEALAILQDSGDDFDVSQHRSKSLKGKGRCLKKEPLDEDEEFSVAKKKAAKAARARAKAQAQAQQVISVPKKRGRPRKHNPVPPNSLHDGTLSPAPLSATTSPSGAKDGTTMKKPRKPARKSALSAEIIQDSESEELMKDAGEGDTHISLNTLSAPNHSSTTTPASHKGDAPRTSTKSLTLTLILNRGMRDAKATHGSGKNAAEQAPKEPSCTPVGSPELSHTSVGSPERSHMSVSSPERSHMSVGSPELSHTPAGSPERSHTPAGSPERSRSPTASPRRRSPSPVAQDQACHNRIPSPVAPVPENESVQPVENQVLLLGQ